MVKLRRVREVVLELMGDGTPVIEIARAMDLDLYRTGHTEEFIIRILEDRVSDLSGLCSLLRKRKARRLRKRKSGL